MAQPTLIARIVPRISKKMLGKYRTGARVSMPRLLEGWAEVIAPEDPVAIQPVRVTWKKLDDGSSEGVLHIAAPSALAARLSYQQAVIVARVNRLFGLPEKGSVRRIALTHDRVAAPAPARPRRVVAVPVPEDMARSVEAVEDPVLRERLLELARAMAADKLA